MSVMRVPRPETVAAELALTLRILEQHRWPTID